MKFKIKKLFNFKKSFIIFFLIIILLTAVGVTLCLVISQDNKKNIWDGTIANSFHSGKGTVGDPYVITNGDEFAYFVSYSNQNDTSNLYFDIDNDIYLNDGVFEYLDNDIIYIKNGNKYYVKQGTYDYYSDNNFTKLLGTLNSIDYINNFSGSLNGGNNTIYGLYITNNDLNTYFINLLSGSIDKIKFNNCFINGNGITSFINDKTGTISDSLFNGSIISSSNTYFVSNTNISSTIKLNGNDNVVDLDVPEINEYSDISNINISGTFKGIDSIIINNTEYKNGIFSINLNTLDTSILVSSLSDSNYEINSLTYKVSYKSSYASFINNNLNLISKCSIKGIFSADNLVSGLSNYISNSVISDNYINVNMIGNDNVFGMTSSLSKSTVNNNILSSDITSVNNSSGLIGYINSFDCIVKNNIITSTLSGKNKSAIILSNNKYNVSTSNNYYTLNNVLTTSYGIFSSIDSILDYELLNNKLEFKFTNTNWIYDNSLPHLYFDTVETPNYNVIINGTSYDLDNNTKDIIYLYDDLEIECDYSNISDDLLKIEYYVDIDYSLNFLDYDDIEYKLYNNKIIYSDNGFYTIYFKVTDLYGNVGYFKSDLFVLDRYNLKIETNDELISLSDYDYQIDNTTKILYSISRSTQVYSSLNKQKLKYYIISNTEFKNGMKFYFTDKINNLLYYYVVDESTDSIDLGNFKLIGTNKNIYFDNNANNYIQNNKYNEEFELIVDYSSIGDNSSYLVDFVLKNENTVISKLDISENNSIKVIIKNDDDDIINDKISISTSNSNILDLSTVGKNEIKISGDIEYKKYNNKEIFSGSSQFDNLYLNIRLVNEDKTIIVDKLSYKYDDVLYYADKYGNVQIPISYNDGISLDFFINVNYIVNEYQNGLYNFEIWVSYSNTNSNVLKIPAIIKNDVSYSSTSFNVSYKENDQIFTLSNNKTLELDNKVDLNITYEGNYNNPKILVYLEKYNFNNNCYETVNINGYLNHKLNESSVNNKYILISEISNKNNNISLDFNIASFTISGYRLVFDLYDGNAFVKERYMNIMVKK